jgi:hypothetical protein
MICGVLVETRLAASIFRLVLVVPAVGEPLA